MTTQTGTEQSDMPFGAVFGAIFFALFSIWLVVGAPADAMGFAPRAFLALGCASLALGLAGQRGWARWAGAVGAIGIAVLSLRLGGLDLGPTVLVALLGAVVTLALLLVPATGEVRQVRRAGPALPAMLGLGVVGFVGSAWLLGDVPLEARTPSSTASDAARPTGGTARATRVDWIDFGAALSRAQTEDKPILVTFVTDWCGYCRKMDQTTWRDASVIDRLADVIAARVDAEDASQKNGYSGLALAERYGVQGFPTIVVLDAGGRVVARQSGYQSSRDLLGWLDSVIGRARRERLASYPTSNP